MDIVAYVLAKKAGVVGGKVTLGTQDKISLGIRGHHLLSTVIGDSASFMIPGQTVDDTGSSSMVECRQEAKETRIITHGNSADAWTTAKSVAIGDRIRPTDAKATGFVYIATVGGTTGAAEPATWTTGVGSTVVDNNITWTRNVVLDKSGALKDGAYPEFVDKFDQEWLSTAENEYKYTYNVIPQQNYVLQRLYYKFGPNLIWDDDTCRVRVHIYRGTSEAGTNIFDKSMGSAEATAVGLTIAPNSEIWINIDNISYSEGEEIHFVVELVTTNPVCQLAIVTNAGFAQPWRAVDRQMFQHVPLVPYDMLYPSVVVTSPADGAIGVSLTPTITTLPGVGKYKTWQGSADIAHTGTVAETTKLTIPILAGQIGTRGKMDGAFYFTATSNTNVKLIKLKLGGTTIATMGLPVSTANISFNFVLWSDSLTAQTIVYVGTGISETFATTAIDLTTAQDLTITIQLSVGTDTVTIKNYHVATVCEEKEQVGEYLVSGTKAYVKKLSTQEMTLIGESTGASVTVATALTGATQYQAYVQHKTGKGVWLPLMAGTKFTTVVNVTVNINTSTTRNGVPLTLVSGDLVELKIGESVNASGYNFHVSNLMAAFPPAAYDSGGLRFTDDQATALNFQVASVTGITPNRTATCYIETNARVISTAKILVTEGV